MSDQAERLHDESWLEREYNPRLTVPNAGEVLAARPLRAMETKARRRPLEIRTGQHPREVLDLFRADAPKGTFVFIHGGFWQVSSKDELSWIADGFVDLGYSTALLNYPLCPEASLDQIVESVRQSFAELYKNVLDDAERASIVVAGHSAGGYLAAALVATDWESYGLTARAFDGAVLISGLYDLAPLVQTSMNQAIGLDAAGAARLGLVMSVPRVKVPVVLAVGELETSEFHRQSELMTQAWAQLKAEKMNVTGANHLTVIDGLAELGSELHRAAMRLLETGV